MDTIDRLQIRELTELSFARFDAQMEQRMATLEHRLERLEATVENCATKVDFVRLEERMNVTFWMFLCWATTTAVLLGIALR